MKKFNPIMRRVISTLCLILFLTMLLLIGAAGAQTTAFTYQGRFTDSTVSQPTNGTYTMTFRLFDAATGGNQLPDNSTAITSMVSVAGGIFTTRLDFGAPTFNPALTASSARYLEIQVGSIVLSPRQEITATPLALRARDAASADVLSAACASCVTNAQINSIDGAKVTGSVANATTANTATTAGNVSGVVAIANGGTGSATKNFVDTTTNQTVGGDKTFTGVLSGDGSGLRNISGANIAGGTTLNPQRLAMRRWYDVNQATLSRPVAIITPSALVFDGTFIYAAIQSNTSANPNGGAVARIRAGTGAIEGSPIPVDRAPSALEFDGTFVYVANQGVNTVIRIRAATGAVEGSPIAVGTNPRGLAFDGTFVYAANSGSDTVTRIRAATGAVEGSPIAVGDTPTALVFDGTFVYAANGLSNTVTRIRAATGAVEGSPIAVGTAPLAFAFDGTFVYVANTDSNDVTRIRAATGVVEGSPIPVGSDPYALAFDGTFVYVANFTSNNVTRF